MKRDLKRIYRYHGIKYFAFPAIVFLMLTALADQRLGNYLEHREEVAYLENRLESNRNILDLHKKIQRNHDELTATFLPVQQQFFVAADVTQSVNSMQEQVRKLLQTLYFDNVEFFEFSDSTHENVTRISMNARFSGVPQQLPRLQAALAQSPTYVGIESLEIRVIDDFQRGGKQLAITARFASLHMKPLTESVPANTSNKIDGRQ